MRYGGQCIVVPYPCRATSGARSLDPALAMVGIHYLRSHAEFPAAATELTKLAARKEIVFDEDILIGLEQAPLALARLYQGANRGKLIVSLVG
jgi:NADPH-dependent curcumin reductase CurA